MIATRIRAAALLSLTLSLMLMTAVEAAAPKATPAHPDFTGIWEHSATSKTRVQTPWTQAARDGLAEDQKLHWRQGLSDENAYCLPAGMPFMMSGSEGFHIVMNPTQMTIINEERPSPRFVYIGGKHPDMSIYDPTTVGHSIAHWEGNELVVDTIGFKAGGTVGFIRSEQTHLTERYSLQDGGKKLKIDFTWEDPILLSKPYSYTYMMERAPADRYAYEYYCDPRDPDRQR
jgi:hypothetical protein